MEKIVKTWRMRIEEVGWGEQLKKGEKAEIILDTDCPAIPQVEMAEVDKASCTVNRKPCFSQGRAAAVQDPDNLFSE